MEFFSIRDIKTESFGTPFPAAHQAVAVRQALSAVQQPDSQLAKYPQDFELWHVGHFNVSDGVFEDTPPTLVSTFTALKQSIATEVENG